MRRRWPGLIPGAAPAPANRAYATRSGRILNEYNILSLTHGRRPANIRLKWRLTMHIEMLPGTTNVVRFPVERRARPTLGLLREIAPDLREVLSIAEAFGLETPAPDLRDRVDAATAEYILNQFGGVGGPPAGALAALLDPVVARAITACRAAHDAAAEAQQAPRNAWPAGQERVEALALRMVSLFIEALVAAEEAEGVARAVGLARRGEPWTPRDLRADEAALFGEAACRAG